MRSLTRPVMTLALALLGPLAFQPSCGDSTRPPPCAGETLGGHCWEYIGPSGVVVTAVAEAEGTSYAGTFDGVLRYNRASGAWVQTGLAGKTITSITALPSGRPLWVTVAPHAPETTSAVAYLSSDGGRTWQARDGGLSSQVDYHGVGISFVVDPWDLRRLYLGQGNGLARSTDSGFTWTYVYPSSADRGIDILALASSSANSRRVWAGGLTAVQTAFVLRSDDRGDTWSVFRPRGFAEDAVVAVTADPRNGDRAFAGMWRAVWVTDDGGTSWRAVVATRDAGFVRALTYSELRLIAVADEGALGLYASDEGGTIWDSLPVPRLASGGTAAASTPDGTLFIATRDGVWRLRLRDRSGS